MSDLLPDWSDIPEDDEAEPLDAEPAHTHDDAAAAEQGG